MNFRYARHTSNLQLVKDFYIDIIGLEYLGSFENHNDYDGIFLGYKNADWHIEFTVSPDAPISTFDEDDLLVFYMKCEQELLAKQQELLAKNIKLEVPKNPYWREHGIMISDPDGYKVVFAIVD
jgi:hypothetical protein